MLFCSLPSSLTSIQLPLAQTVRGRLREVETWSEQRSGDPLIEALKAPVVARFAGFLGLPPVRGTLSWMPDRRITVTGRRGNDPFEEVIR